MGGYSTDRCLECGKRLIRNHKNDFCQQHYIEHRHKEKLKNWLDTGELDVSADSAVRGIYRDYILSSQNNTCAICGIPPMWNNHELTFILDHIDGDASNQKRENLRLVCPNCDSQLSTYKSRNKHSARNYRKTSVTRVTPVYQIDPNTNGIIRVFDSVVEASNTLKCSVSSIEHALNGYNKTAEGYCWKYAKMKV